MKILLLGRNGQLGWELQRSLAPLGDLIALERDSLANPDGLCGDLTRLDALAETVQRVRPDVIVNAAAYTAVDKAQSEVATAHRVNAEAVAVLAEQARNTGAWVVHFSTDYVFDGKGEAPWKEDDSTGPLNVYGESKLAGEMALTQWSRHLILRTSWVYGSRGGNFAKTMLRLACTRDTLNVIDDQYGAPTGADLLADVTSHMLRQIFAQSDSDHATVLAGTYHVAAAGCTHWFEYAKYVLDQAERAPEAIKLIATQVNPVPTSAFPTPAARPHNSRLCTDKLQSLFGLQLPAWESGVARMLSEINYDYTR
jgi:dTDP-4-dehydrorhamnose reductase